MHFHYLNKSNSTLNRLSIAWELSKYSCKKKTNSFILGAFWSFLEPFILFLILVFLRNKLGSSDIKYYPVYLFVGLFSYQFFCQATRRIMVSLAANSRYAKTFSVPLETYIYATFFETFRDCSFQLVILAGIVAWSGLPLLMFVPFVLFFLVFSVFVLGTGFVLAGINVYFRDLEVIWGLVSRVLFFATPIFYTIEFAPPIIRINPLVSYLEQFRGVLIDNEFNLALTTILLVFSFGFFLLGRMLFNLLQRRIVEVL